MSFDTERSPCSALSITLSNEGVRGRGCPSLNIATVKAIIQRLFRFLAVCLGSVIVIRVKIRLRLKVFQLVGESGKDFTSTL